MSQMHPQRPARGSEWRIDADRLDAFGPGELLRPRRRGGARSSSKGWRSS
jgi:hypothetical protein